MVDANIIISAGLFPESTIGKAFSHIAKNHKLVLCQYIINETENVFKNKFPEKSEHFYEFIKKYKYELVNVKINNNKNYPNIRDINDLPILVNAIESKVDLLLTGDKDFDDIKIEKLKIIKPRKYIDEYM